MKRLLLAASVAAAGCGPAGPELSLLVQALPGGASFDLRLFGQAVNCNLAQTPEGRTRLHTIQLCTAAEADTSTTCHMQRKKAQAGVVTRMDNITPGTRVVFGVELDAAEKELGWACTTAEVKVGAIAQATLAFTPN